MQDKVCLVTGANSGIGRATALALAQRGATVVMVCRRAAEGEAARDDIIAQSGQDRVDLLLADLSQQASIRALAQTFRQQYDRLDVLVNNAAAIFRERLESADGIEMTLALNHLGYFLLTNLLLDLIIASAPARIINVASDAHVATSRYGFDLAQLQLETGYNGFRAYSQSKAANILFTYELARRLDGRGVTVNALHPGAVGTPFHEKYGGPYSWLMRLVRPLLPSPTRGASTVVYLATSDEVAGVTGGYFAKSAPHQSAPFTTDEALAAELWTVSAALTGLD